MQETWVPSLGQEDPLEKEVATHSNILAWEIPRTDEPGRPESTGSQLSNMTEQLDQHCHKLSSLQMYSFSIVSLKLERSHLLGLGWL